VLIKIILNEFGAGGLGYKHGWGEVIGIFGVSDVRSKEVRPLGWLRRRVLGAQETKRVLGVKFYRIGNKGQRVRIMRPGII